jgi:hypothetical protein
LISLSEGEPSSKEIPLREEDMFADVIQVAALIMMMRRVRMRAAPPKMRTHLREHIQKF